MAQPLITIGLTCFNAATSITAAISAALAQDYAPLEVIVVDDASTDNSVAVIENLCRNHANLKLIKHAQNAGVGAARQTILEHAKGEFITFADDDDISAPARITTQLHAILKFEAQTGQQLVACYASGTRLYPNGYQIPILAIGTQPIIPHGVAMAARMLYFKTNAGWAYGGTPACALMARRSTFITAGGFDSAFRRVEDIDWAIRLALMGGYFIGTPEPLYTQYATTGSDKTADKNLAAELQLIDKHQAFLQQQGFYLYAKLWVRLRHAYFTRAFFKLIFIFTVLLGTHPVATLRHIATTGPARLRRDFNLRKKP